MSNKERNQFKPILFSTPMVQAIIEGKKTQTRRIVKFPKDFEGKKNYKNGQFGLKYSSNEFEGCLRRLYPKWEVGDILWVRETWACISHLNPDCTEYEYFYRESNLELQNFKTSTNEQ